MTPFDRLLSTMIKPWVAVSYIGFVIVSILYIDTPIAYYFHSLDSQSSLHLFNKIMTLGEGKLYIVVFFILALFFRYIYHNKAWEVRTWFLWLCVFIPNIICLSLKVGLGRARPDLLFKDQLYGFYGFKTQVDYWSFPSGHTTTVMGLVFGMSVLFPRYTYGYMLFGLLIVMSRVMFTNHYLSDVMVASYLVLIEVGLLHYWFRRKNWLITPANDVTNLI